MPLLPWCLEIALVALPFVLVGDKCYTLDRDKNHWSMIIIVLLIIIGGFFFSNNHVDMRVHSFAEWWIFYPVALSFIYLTIKLSGIILHYEHGVLQWVGRNSLINMCVHEPVKRIVLKIVSVISGIDISVLRGSVVASFLLSIIIIFLLFPGVCFINRYMPFILGKKPNSIASFEGDCIKK